MKRLSYAPVIILLLNSILTLPLVSVNAVGNVDAQTYSDVAEPRSLVAVGQENRARRLRNARRVLRGNVPESNAPVLTESEATAPSSSNESDLDDASSLSTELNFADDLPEHHYEEINDATYIRPVEETYDDEHIYEVPLTAYNSSRGENVRDEIESERSITPPPLPTRKSCLTCGRSRSGPPSTSDVPHTCDPVTGICRKIQTAVRRTRAVRDKVVNGIKTGAAKIRRAPRVALRKVKQATKGIGRRVRNGGERVKDGVKRIGRKIANGGRAVRSQFSRGVDSTRNGVRTIQRKASNGGRAIKRKVSGTALKVDKTYGRVKTNARNSVHKVGDRIRTSTGNVAEKVGAGLYRAGDRFNAAARKMDGNKPVGGGGAVSNSDTGSVMDGPPEIVYEDDYNDK